MIDPVQALAFSVTSTPGAYALLLGSGVSRAASIPTGWEITLELVRKVARLDEHEPADAEEWFWKKYDKAPDYAELLDAVTQTPSERQQLLRSYWEPNEAERSRGLKQPTAAHRHIADLIAMNVIRVVITTNFDRLLETALGERGIIPTVISSVDQIQGAMPLIHCQCCIIKVHGDYLDTRIRNTPTELARYEPEMDKLLDRVFDEFGLITCGWSAEWDEALRSAITRAPSRRFAMYWAARGEVGEKANALLTHRLGVKVPIDGADEFFASLHASVKALRDFAKPHPLSKEIALARLKDYLSSPNLNLQLEELVLSEAEKARRAIDDHAFSLGGTEPPTAEIFTKRIVAYDAAVETLVALAVAGVYWARPEHASIWRRALEIVHKAPDTSGTTYTSLVGAANYPGMKLIYAIGLAAVSAGNLPLLSSVFAAETSVGNGYVSAVEQLPPMYVFKTDNGPKQLLLGYQRRHFPMNEYLRDQLRGLFKRIHPQDKSYNFCFVKLEVHMSLAWSWRRKRAQHNYWTPPGLWFYDNESREATLDEIATRLGDRETSVYASRFIGDDWADASNRFVTFKEMALSLFAGQFY